MGELTDLDTAPETHHLPVLLTEVLEGLDVVSGERYIDGTVGGGGHALAILETSAPSGRLLALDRDPEAAARATARLEPFGERATVVHASYDRLRAVAEVENFVPVAGVLFDLGFSSWQVDDPTRGFAFRLVGPLDMRFDPSAPTPSAADLVNTLTAEELAQLLWEYGEERQSRRIAQAIVSARPLRTTEALAEVVSRAVGGRRGRLHPATRTFQALRIAVNQELERLEAALPQALEVLRPGGRLAVITFHSLEDRLVKQFLKREASDCICPPRVPICTCEHQAQVALITRKPVLPSAAEREANPRSRSAKLRIAEKLP